MKKHGGRVDLRHRLPAGALGPDRARARRGALRRERERVRSSADDPAGLRRDRRHRGGDPYRRRLDRHAGRLPEHPKAGAGGADRGQARADGLHRVRSRDPGRHREGHQGPGLPDRGVQHLRRGRCLHERLPPGLSARCADRGVLQVRQCLRRLRGLAPRLRAGGPELDRAFLFLRAWLDRAGAAKDAGLEQIHWSTTRTRKWPQVLAMAFDHRAQLEAIADAAEVTREHIPYFKKLCLAAARRAASGRPDFGILLDGRLGQAALDDATGDRDLDRPADRAAGADPGPLRGRRRRRLHATRMAGRPLRQMPDLLPPGRPGGAARRAGGAGAPPVRRLPQDLP